MLSCMMDRYSRVLIESRFISSYLIRVISDFIMSRDPRSDSEWFVIRSFYYW